MTHAYTRECHENGSTRFWASMDPSELMDPAAKTRSHRVDKL